MAVIVGLAATAAGAFTDATSTSATQGVAESTHGPTQVVLVDDQGWSKSDGRPMGVLRQHT
jgi:hypothetical protein